LEGGHLKQIEIHPLNIHGHHLLIFTVILKNQINIGLLLYINRVVIVKLSLFCWKHRG